MNKRLLAGVVLFAGVLITVGFLFSWSWIKSADISAAQFPRWTENVGFGKVVPACSSASPSVTCSGSTAQASLSWSYGGQHGSCTSASISLSDGQSVSGQPCSGGYTFNVVSDTNYNYTLSWIGSTFICDQQICNKNGCYCVSGHSADVTIDSTSGSFSTPVCAPPPPPTPSVSLSAPSSVILPDTIGLSWTSSNADSCTASGSWSGGKPTSGSESVSKPRGTYTFNLSCSGPGGSAQEGKTVEVVELPQMSFTVNPPTLGLGGQVTLSWSGTGSTSCSIDHGVGSVNPSSGSVNIYVDNTTTFTLSCSNPDGSRNFQTTVNVGLIPRIIEILPRP